MAEPVVALFCGGRDWADHGPIRDDLHALPADSVVIAGGQRGADRLAASIAQSMAIHVAEVRPYWWKFGKRAGRKRNEAMLRLRPDVVYAYSTGGPGTAHMVEIALAAGIPVRGRGVIAPAFEEAAGG